jgi:hypothetical protein
MISPVRFRLFRNGAETYSVFMRGQNARDQNKPTWSEKVRKKAGLDASTLATVDKGIAGYKGLAVNFLAAKANYGRSDSRGAVDHPKSLAGTRRSCLVHAAHAP